MKHCLLLLLFTLIVDVPAIAQTVDGTKAKESIGEEILRQTQSHGERQNGGDKIAPGNVPANIYDGFRAPREIQTLDGRTIIRDCSVAPEAPQWMTAPQGQTLLRTEGILYDALPPPDTRTYPNNKTQNSTPLYERKPSGWLPFLERAWPKSSPVLKH